MQNEQLLAQILIKSIKIVLHLPVLVPNSPQNPLSRPYEHWNSKFTYSLLTFGV